MVSVLSLSTYLARINWQWIQEREKWHTAYIGNYSSYYLVHDMYIWKDSFFRGADIWKKLDNASDRYPISAIRKSIPDMINSHEKSNMFLHEYLVNNKIVTSDQCTFTVWLACVCLNLLQNSVILIVLIMIFIILCSNEKYSINSKHYQVYSITSE